MWWRVCERWCLSPSNSPSPHADMRGGGGSDGRPRRVAPTLQLPFHGGAIPSAMHEACHLPRRERTNFAIPRVDFKITIFGSCSSRRAWRAGVVRAFFTRGTFQQEHRSFLKLPNGPEILSPHVPQYEPMPCQAMHSSFASCLVSGSRGRYFVAFPRGDLSRHPRVHGRRPWKLEEMVCVSLRPRTRESECG